MIMQTRKTCVDQLKERGFHVLPSAANFIFARVPVERYTEGAAGVFKKLGEAGVLVRYWSQPRLNQWLRISIGTPEDMQKLMGALDE